MIIKKINSYFIINKVKEHNNIKKNILNLINKIPNNTYENIFHTDWNLPADYKREYLEYSFNYLNPYLKKISDFLHMKKTIIHNAWFQQYKKENFHEWHVHAECNYTNIYYLEMPNKNFKTKILDILTKEIINIDVVEGDLLTIPANFLHCSEIIKTNETKTIISFNTSFDNYG